MNRALLLTDVVDSTALAERLGDAAMAALWAKHDRVARDLLPVHNGREIDKTDGFLLLFEAAADAVAYALAYHEAIGALDPPLKARAGLHVGPVILTENAPADVALGAKPLEVDGLAKPTAARIMGLASGGQTLLSAEARAALGTTPLRVESHGHWRMKGVSDPMELFEVGDEDAPFTPPPDGAKVYRVVRDGQHWLPVKQVKHSLPTERDAFVGRQSDLHDLARLLDDGAHLVSVLGMGGTGKTRLVTHYGWTWLGDWPGGVWFCDLSEARGVDGIVYAVARALDVPLGKDDPVVQLGHAIAGRGRCLVLLDNFEQVAQHAGQTLGRWLDRAHDAQFVVTTREVLGLSGEDTLALAPLPAPDGAALFVARARSARRDFEPDDMAAIEALVKLLDGLPLAIELAAARVRVMPPSTLLARMSERFKLLTSSGGRHTRQATLRGALDWSWDLLSTDEQAALAQLSVFEGGFTLEAAESALSLGELWPTDAVQALVDKSLVRTISDRRFDLLVSVQEYAAEKLEARGERAQAEARHGAWFARLGTGEALAALNVRGGVARRRSLVLELDNLVAACRRSVDRGAGGQAVAHLRATWEVVENTGPAALGIELAERVLAMPGLSAADRVAALGAGGRALQLAGRIHEARAHFDRALAIARSELTGQDRFPEAVVLAKLGELHRLQGRADESRAHLDAALAIARADPSWGDPSFEGRAVGSLGAALRDLGRIEEARAHYEAALALVREVGDRRVEGIMLGNLGIVLVDQGRREEALAHFDAALAIHREVGDRRAEGYPLANRSALLVHEGRVDEAFAHLEAALAVHRAVGNRQMEGQVLGNLGALRMGQGRLQEARTHLEAALAVAREVGERPAEGRVLYRLATLHHGQGRTGEARALLRDGERLLRDVRQPWFLAELLCFRAVLDAEDGDAGAARGTLAEAQQLADGVGATPDSSLGQALTQARVALGIR